jgi:alpha/beta hydrolase family protein
MQKNQPPLLVVWGKHDLSFDPGEPERYRKDVPNADVQVLDAGHFALDTKAPRRRREDASDQGGRKAGDDTGADSGPGQRH